MYLKPGLRSAVHVGVHQALAAAEGADSQFAAQVALSQAEALLVSDGAPFASRLLAARARLLLQLRRRADFLSPSSRMAS